MALRLNSLPRQTTLPRVVQHKNRRGLRADFVVLSGSPVLSEEQAELPAVVSTYMDGRCQHGCRRVRMARLVSDGMWQILHDP